AVLRHSAGHSSPEFPLCVLYPPVVFLQQVRFPSSRSLLPCLLSAPARRTPCSALPLLRRKPVTPSSSMQTSSPNLPKRVPGSSTCVRGQHSSRATFPVRSTCHGPSSTFPSATVSA